MEITRIVTGQFATNTYLLSEGDRCILIDPASKSEKMISLLEGRKLLAVLLTHGHFDHIKAVDGLYKNYHMPVFIAGQDVELVRDRNQGMAFLLSSVVTVSCPLTELKDEKMEIGPFSFSVYFTPGHTKGSVCFDFGDDLFTGDTLFNLSCGRTDLKGGSQRELNASLRFLSTLDPSKRIHPGHDEESTLEFEIKNNPFLGPFC